VPMLQCGLVRSNFALPIAVSVAGWRFASFDRQDQAYFA
jgi:hypothetical protein